MAFKEQKEAFVSGSTGSSVSCINQVCLTSLTTYAVWTALEPQLASRGGALTWRTPAAEFCILVAPLLLSLTALSRYPVHLNAILVALVLLIRQIDPPPPPNLSRVPSDPLPKGASPGLPPNRLFVKPFVTVYRAHMMLMTVICILAVDFRVFPRKFAKAETWGTSLMDLGVGSFVFSLGLVSALPLLRTPVRTPFFAAVWGSTKKSAGILALGVGRVLMVKGVDYPEHVSEYGVHWNFFFTLGLLPVFGALLERLAPYISFTAIALIISGGHQLALDQTWLQYWTLTAARTTLLTQNKEGIVSLPGYLAIYLFGIATGIYVLPPNPTFFARIHKPIPVNASKDAIREIEAKKQKAWKPKPEKLASVLGSYTIVWWSIFYILRFAGWTVSRRMANLPYVIWIAAFNTSFLLAYLLIHTWALTTYKRSSAPAIFEAINRNGLVVFLVANLLTGLVNVSIESMYASDSLAVGVLLAYCAAVVAAAWALRKRRLRI